MQQSVKIFQQQAMNESASAVNVAYTSKNAQRQTEVRDCLLLYSSISFVSPFSNQKCKAELKFFRTILFGFQTLSLTLTEEQRLMVFMNRVLQKILGLIGRR